MDVLSYYIAVLSECFVLICCHVIFIYFNDISNGGCNRAVKLLEHGMKVVERVMEKRLCRVLTVDEMRFGSMP